MKRFNFTLEKALEVKELHKFMKEQELGRCFGDVQKTKSKLRDVDEAIKTSQEYARGFLKGELDPKVLKDFQKFGRSLKLDRTALDKTLNFQVERWEKARLDALESVKAEKTLRNLKERVRRDFDKTYRWEETKALDELGFLRHIAKEGDSL